MTMNTTIATISNNDDTGRLGLCLANEMINGEILYTIRTDTDEDTGLGFFGSKAEAIAAISQAWGAECWDLQAA
jgi:hypothetical protein